MPQTSLPPVASLAGWTPNDAQLVQYKAYTFTATATDPNIGGSITQFNWNFGDGATQATPSSVVNGKATATCMHAFNTAGTPTLTVTAANSANLVSKPVTQALTVNAATSPLTVMFTAPAAPLTVSPSLGSSATVTFTVKVANTGTGTVSVPGIHLDPGDTKAAVGAPTDLGGGSWSIPVAYAADSAIGQRQAAPTLTVLDSNGASSAATSGPAITIRTVSASDTAPVISMVATPKISAGANATWQGVAIDFTATASDLDQDPITYTWTFGDGGNSGDVAPTQSANALKQSHTYASPGIYPVTFKADDGRGVAGVSVKTITLNLNILANAAPTLDVAFPAGSLYANVPVTFTATTSDANGDALALSWDFGDGTAKVTNTNPVIHSFAASGATTVAVTADDGKGGVTVWTGTLDLLVNRPPVSKVTTTSSNLYQNKAYTFTATATDPDAGNTITEYQWDFGDGTAVVSTATGTTQHTYASTFTGAANVKVRAVDNHGSTGDFSPAVAFTVLKTDLPVVAFTSPGATSLNAEINGTVSQVFILTATNPRAGTPGVTDPIPVGNITFNSNDANATVTSAVSNGGGSYSFTVQYTGASAQSTRTATPSAYATDTLGIQGQSANGPMMTINTLGANHQPSIVITTPATPSTSAYTSKLVTLTFTLTDQDNDPLSYTVNWGGPDAPPCQPVTATGTTSSSQKTQNGVSVTLTHIYPDTYSGIATVSVDATDNRSSSANAITQSRTIQVTVNALPTASIRSPQASGTLMDPATITDSGQGVPVITQDPTTNSWVADPTGPSVVVIPANGKLTFNGDGTAPTSGGSLSYKWAFPGGVPASSASQNPGEVVFPGVPGQTVAYRVDLTVTDATDAQDANCAKVGRTSLVVPTKTQKWVIVDAANTQSFNLNFLYRQIQDSTGTSTLAPVTTAGNGKGATIQVFQDGVTYGYKVQDAQGLNAAISLPVRSNLPFWLDVPAFGSDGHAYFMRIPSTPVAGDPNADPTLVNGTPNGTWTFPYLTNAVDATANVSTFGFRYPSATSGPWDPTLNLVTAQGYAAETTPASLRKIQGTLLSQTSNPASPFKLNSQSDVWLDRLSVPSGDTTSPLVDFGTFTLDPLAISGVTAYQTFAEWPAVLELERQQKNSDVQFNLNYAKQSGTSPTTTIATPTALRAFRVPAGSTDPYDMDVAGWTSSSTNLAAAEVDSSVPAFFQGMVANPTASGGLQGLSIPYDANDPDRKVLASPGTRDLLRIQEPFSFADYLWARVWARPLVLNATTLGYDKPLNSASTYFFSNVATGTWPKNTSGISPDNSTFDLTPSGGTDFDPTRSPVGTAGTPITAKGVGRFYWTDYTPLYNANPGANIARTWLAQGAAAGALALQPPTSASGIATAYLGFVPPQDTVVDKRGRTATGALDGNTTGGYRVAWFNATRDGGGAPVPPDFWVVELRTTAGTSQFMLPGNFPLTYPTYTYNSIGYADPESITILTDARENMARLSDRQAANGVQVVAPGYCWFDVPSEMRPASGTSATLTVFALKAVPRTVVGRPLNRTEWIEAIKTATARISVDAGAGDLSPIYKIPFNYAWDIVITNGPATPVAP